MRFVTHFVTIIYHNQGTFNIVTIGPLANYTIGPLDHFSNKVKKQQARLLANLQFLQLF